MVGLANGIAHISFDGGGIVMPARNSYDRQLVAEQVTAHARKKGRVQILLEEDRWMVYGRQPHSGAARCSWCGSRMQPICYRSDQGETAYCLPCALGEEPRPASASPMLGIRRAS